MPKVMLIELRKVTDTIPTITQLNNYLKNVLIVFALKAFFQEFFNENFFQIQASI